LALVEQCFSGRAAQVSYLSDFRLLAVAHRLHPARGWEAQHVAPIDPNHGVEPCIVRLRHAPESGFGQFNHSIIMDDEIQAQILRNAVGYGFN
jgi:hypothetical protein